MHSIFLKDVIESVPVCAQTVSLSTLLEIFTDKGCDRIVAVNQANHPVGLVSLQKLLPILLGTNLLPISTSTTPKALNAAQTSLQDVCLASEGVLTPLGILSAELSLSQFATISQAPSYFSTDYALVNPLGEFLGLLSRLQLLKVLTQTAGIPMIAKPVPRVESVMDDRPHQRDIDPVQVTLKSILKLLEQLPLPLMLQTSAGQMLVQNSVWHQQVGELRDPAWIRHEAATLLEPMSLRSSLLAQNRVGESATQSWDLNVDTMTESTVASLCQIGVDANTCVCACPMKDGEDRIWEFTKIPLNLSVPDLSIPQVLAGTLGLPNASAQTWSVENFRLAALVNTLSGDAAPFSHDVKADSFEDLWLVLAQDKTEQQQVARELAAKNADLVQLNRMKDEFLACISHELKTPLTAILGLSSLLKDQRLGDLNERQARYAGLIHQSGRHLVTMVNDILDLTRMETGQLELILEPVNVLTICDRVCQKVQQQDAPEGDDRAENLVVPQRIALEIEPGLGMIVADELRLHQMLMNLLSNAVKFTPKGGKIGLNVSAWEGWIAFTVWDTGIGIPADKQHLIFQKFQQLENPLTRRFEGTGLGLVLTQRLTRLHGGDVTFISKEGEGSEFTLLLPPSSPWQDVAGNMHGVGMDAEPRSTHRNGGTREANRLILVVEAVPRFVEDLTDRLLSLGYRVVIARSGTEAIEKVRKLQPRVVLLNPSLPLLSGWDVLTLLKSDAETRHIPVVMTAARAERNQALRNQADDFLNLPIESEALQESLTRFAFHSMAQPEPQPSLTILLLGAGEANLSQGEGYGSDLSGFLRSHHHRILEVDDIDQARMLTQVWKPHVLLLEPQLPDSLSLLKKISQSALLSSLPLITLTSAMTEAANQFPNLAVFPCLALQSTLASAKSVGLNRSTTPALLQVLQVAAGLQKHARRILAIDLSSMTLAETTPNGRQSSDWLQALMQYVQVAGLTGVIGRSWAEVLQQLQHQSADVLLICVRDTAAITDSTSVASLVRALAALEQLPSKPPILVLNQTSIRTHSEQRQPNHGESWNLMPALEAIATRILPASLSMAELLEEIKRIV